MNPVVRAYLDFQGIYKALQRSERLVGERYVAYQRFLEKDGWNAAGSRAIRIAVAEDHLAASLEDFRVSLGEALRATSLWTMKPPF